MAKPGNYPRISDKERPDDGGEAASSGAAAGAEAGASGDESPLIGIADAARLSEAEQATAARLKALMPELELRESPHVGAEYLDQYDRSYDAVGDPRASQYWNEEVFLASIDDHLLKANDFTVVDVTGFAQEHVDAVRDHLDGLTGDEQAKVIRIGFE